MISLRSIVANAVKAKATQLAGKAKNALSDIANDTTTAVKNVGSSIVDTAKEANYQLGKSISENLVEPIKENLAEKGVDLTKPAEWTKLQQAVEYAKRVPIAGTAIFDQFAIKNPTKAIGQVVDLYSDYWDDGKLNASSKTGAKARSVIQTFGENVWFQKPVTSAGDVFNAGKALINSETKAQAVDNALKVGNSLFQTVMNANPVANVVWWAFQTGMKESGADVAVEKVTKQWANILSDTLQNIWVQKKDADSLGRTLIDSIITATSLIGYAKGSSKVGGYKQVAVNMAKDDLKTALKTNAIPKSDAASFLLSRTKEIESNLRPVDVMKYNAWKILTDVKYQSAAPIITAIIDGVQNWFDQQKLEDAGKAITATTWTTILWAVPLGKPTGKKSKAPTIDEAQTKIAIDEAVTPKVETLQEIVVPKEVKPKKTRKPKAGTLEDISKQEQLKALDEITGWEKVSTAKVEEAMTPEAMAKAEADAAKAEALKARLAKDEQIASGINSFKDQQEIPKQIQLRPWFFPSFLKKQSDRLLSTRTYLNNFLFWEWKEAGGNFLVQKHQKDKVGMARTITEAANIVQNIKDVSGETKVPFDPKDMIGKTGTMWGEITDKNYREYDKTRTRDAKSLANKYQFTSGIQGADISPEMVANANNNSYIYNIIKWDQALLDKYFTPEQQASLADVASRYDRITGATTREFIDDKTIPEYIADNPNYKRLVMTGEWFKEASKYWREPAETLKVVDEKWNVREFSSFEDLERFIQVNPKIKDLNPEVLSSLTKEQAWPQYDPYRFHGDIPSLLSYADAMGKLWADKQAAKALDVINTNTNGEIQRFASEMNSPAYASPLNEIIGIQSRPTTKGWKLAQIAMEAGSKWVMLGNFKNAITTTIPTMVKWLTMSLLQNAVAWMKWRTLKSFSPVITRPSDKNYVNARLIENGFINENQIADQTMFGDMSKKTNRFFQASWAEQPISGWVALNTMKNQLIANGKLEWGRFQTSAKDVVDAWEAWSKEKSPEYYEAKDTVTNNLRVMWAQSTADKLGVPGVPAPIRDGIGSLKAWWVGQWASTLENLGKLRTAVSEKIQQDLLKKNVIRTTTDQQVVNSLIGLAGKTSAWATTAALAYQLYEAKAKADGIDTESEEAKKMLWNMSSASASSLAGNPITEALAVHWAYFGAVAPSVLASIYGATSDGIKSLVELAGWNDEAAKTRFRWALQKLNAMNVFKWPSDIIWVLTGESGVEKLAKQSLTFSPEESTKYGLATGVNYEGRTERLMKLLWFDFDQKQLDTLYDAQNRMNMNVEWVTNPIAQTALMWLSNQYRYADKWLALGSLPNFEVAWAKFGQWESAEDKTFDNQVKSQYAYDTTNNLLDSKTLDEFLQKNGIDASIKEAVKKEIAWLYESNIKSNRETGKKALWTDYPALNTTLSDENFTASMNELKTRDPYLFNQIISFVGNIAYEQDRSGRTLVAGEVTKQIQDIVEWKNKSAKQEDYAISQRLNEDAISTAFTNSVLTGFKDIKDLTSGTQEDRNKAVAKFRELDNLSKLVLQSNTYKPYEKAFANIAVDMKSALEQLYTSGWTGERIGKEFPNLAYAIKQGLENVRGASNATPIPSWIVTTPSSTPSIPSTPATATPTATPTLASIVAPNVVGTTGQWIITKPIQLWQLKIDTKSPQAQPLFKTKSTTLRETLWQQPKAKAKKK